MATTAYSDGPGGVFQLSAVRGVYRRAAGERARARAAYVRIEQPHAALVPLHADARGRCLAVRAVDLDDRWAVDATHVFCGRDGWCHLTATIDCCDRTIVGWRLSKTGVAKLSAAALEDALRRREIKPGETKLMLRSDNGLVFGAKPFVAVVNR